MVSILWTPLHSIIHTAVKANLPSPASATLDIRYGLPGVMAYGANQEEAVRKVKSIALQILADMIESGEEVPEPLKVLFAA
jgi:hypothetical protein